MTVSSDWEIHASNSQDMTTALKSMGFAESNGIISSDGFIGDGGRYSILIYGTKYIRSKTQTFVNVFGMKQFVNVAQPGVYAIMRWLGATAFPPHGVKIPPQVTIIPLPADSPHVFE